MIEPATLEDLDAVTELWVALAADQRAHGSHVRGEASREAMRQSLGEKIVDDRVFVARPSEPILGFVSVSMDAGTVDLDVSRGVLENVYVREGHRDKGLGTALLERAERALAARGADVVSLEVLAGNEAARALYRRVGYRAHRIEAEKRLGSDTD